MSNPAPFALDHIIILLPAKSLESLPTSFTNALTITPGGTHADGKTYNQLVILQSGVYLEFIAFVEDDPARKQGHWWGQKTAGSTIDWALTSKDVRDLKKLGESYDEPRKGGRKRPDGKSVEWYVTFPKQGTERGSVPFFCHDVTPRELRVPMESVQHPSGAVGVDRIVIVAAKERIDELEKSYDDIFGGRLEGHARAWGPTEPSIEDGSMTRIGRGPVIELKEVSDEEDAAIVKMNGGVAGVKAISLLCTSNVGRKHDEEIVETFEEAKIRIGFRYVEI